MGKKMGLDSSWIKAEIRPFILSARAVWTARIPRGGVVFDSKATSMGSRLRAGASTQWEGWRGRYSSWLLPMPMPRTSFASFTGTATGANPYAGVVFDAQGNIYGTTYKGGTYGFGTVFKLDTAGNLTALYSFGSISNDGKYPEASVVLD